ncbi:hypothetical protein OPV22_016960 [Ensete ventricosum]|uniref:Uncharacterized protein n=1 Tax=Ensete ventricosum TaxID=4639 RepID=A0AAV8QSS4_ENSVE|nr:hypothetical protein OPV22_016960 [Ensete ventricosum]
MLRARALHGHVEAAAGGGVRKGTDGIAGTEGIGGSETFWTVVGVEAIGGSATCGAVGIGGTATGGMIVTACIGGSVECVGVARVRIAGVAAGAVASTRWRAAWHASELK